MTAPQGQFIASQSTVLAKFLADAQVRANFVPGACVPASIQMLDDRLKTDETAITDEKTLIGQLQTQLQASDSRTHQLSLLLGLVAGGVGILMVVLIALGSAAETEDAGRRGASARTADVRSADSWRGQP